MLIEFYDSVLDLEYAVAKEKLLGRLMLNVLRLALNVAKNII